MLYTIFVKEINDGLTEEILSSIKRKSISSLRKKDTVNEQKELESKIKSIQSEKADVS